MFLENGEKRYYIDELIARTSASNFYFCHDNEEQFFLQISASLTQNPKNDFAAYLLRDLSRVSELYENSFRKKFPDQHLNYSWLFPRIRDSFRPLNQAGRIVNIMSIDGLPNLKRAVPLSNIRDKDHLLVDLASNVWITGRMLKLLVFTHDQNISIKLSSDNVIIEPEQHRVVVLDWTKANLFQEAIPELTRCNDIASVAKTSLIIMGEDESNGRYGDNDYVSLLRELAKAKQSDAQKAYQDFEFSHASLLDRNQFYKFSTFPI